jgi:hypothetical protein
MENLPLLPHYIVNGHTRVGGAATAAMRGIRRHGNKWRVDVKIRGTNKKKYIGLFMFIGEAQKAYAAADREINGHRKPKGGLS